MSLQDTPAHPRVIIELHSPIQATVNNAVVPGGEGPDLATVATNFAARQHAVPTGRPVRVWVVTRSEGQVTAEAGLLHEDGTITERGPVTNEEVPAPSPALVRSPDSPPPLITRAPRPAQEPVAAPTPAPEPASDGTRRGAFERLRGKRQAREEQGAVAEVSQLEHRMALPPRTVERPRVQEAEPPTATTRLDLPSPAARAWLPAPPAASAPVPTSSTSTSSDTPAPRAVPDTEPVTAPVRIRLTPKAGDRPAPEPPLPSGPPIPEPHAPMPRHDTPPPPPQQASHWARDDRASATFLTHSQEGPTPTGMRGVMAKMGIVKGASPEAQSRWEDERAVSQHWPGPRTVAVVNGKGGAGKTPATILLSAIYARLGGGGVLAWDNNVTRGTLGWRTEQGPHAATLLDLLPCAESYLDPTARASDLMQFLHHQTEDKFDVLRSNPLLLAKAQKLTPEQLDLLHRVLTRYYRLLFMDSGNDEGDSLWLSMIDHADQIVVPTNTRPDCAEAGRLLLDTLFERDERSARLAARAVVIVSQADREEAAADRIAEGYRQLTEHVVTVPYDPAMRAEALRWDRLAPATRRAYLSAAAAVARQL